MVALAGQFLLPRLAQEFGLDSHAQYWLWMIPAFLVVGTALLNLDVNGMNLMALGVALNALVISVNFGMPISRTAAHIAGVQDMIPVIESARGLYFVAGAHTPLMVLADVLPVPGPTYVRTIVSVGDMLLFVGVAVLLITTMLGQSRERGRGLVRDEEF